MASGKMETPGDAASFRVRVEKPSQRLFSIDRDGTADGESLGEKADATSSILQSRKRRRNDDFQYVLPGDLLVSDSNHVRGHGTYLRNGGLVSSQAGIVYTVNRLVTVRPVRSRYIPEVGDVIVGRVAQISNKRWMIDINARHNATLLLSSVYLPEGIQRRRTQEDELNMRNLFVEGDPISAEIQELRNDGSIALHTRSLKYGRLFNGVLVEVHPSLIRRAKKHFVLLPRGIHAILGTNGYIWLSPFAIGREANQEDYLDAKNEDKEISIEAHSRVSFIRNIIAALDSQFVSIDSNTIAQACEECERLNVDLKDMVRPDIRKAICGVFENQEQ